MVALNNVSKFRDCENWSLHVSTFVDQEISPYSSFITTLTCPPRIMARTKKTAKKYGKPLITWTRFHLPREQE